MSPSKVRRFPSKTRIVNVQDRRKAMKKLHTKDEIPTVDPTNFNVAIIQTGCFGDNINSTLMLKPIKDWRPDARIDVYTSIKYAAAFHNNPYIDNVFKYDAQSKNEALHLTKTLEPMVNLMRYKIVISAHPMYNPTTRTSRKHPHLGENLVYSWVRALEDFNIPYELPLVTSLKLTPEEVSNVDRFMSCVGDGRKNIMEVHGESGQTFWDGRWTNAVVEKLCSRGELVFISHATGIPELQKRFPNKCFNVNHLTIREAAELYNRCDKFFSVSSGLSNACNTNWCRKDVEWVEVVNSKSCSSAGIRENGKIFWHDNDLTRFLATI